MKVSAITALVAASGLAQCQSMLPPPLHQLFLAARGPFDDGVKGNGSFTQLIDHENPSLGTFQQRFFFNDEFWGGPGYPVILTTPGESACDENSLILTDNVLYGLVAKATKAAVVVIEHRYFGESAPYVNQTVENLQYLTVDNSVADLVRFARQVKLPFDTSGRSNAPQAPWILTGGSYAGTLAAWTAKLAPGTMWAYQASSAPLQAIEDFWQWWAPIGQNMPVCRGNLIRITGYLDDILLSGNRRAIQELKASFGLGGLEHDDDFALVISLIWGFWQEMKVHNENDVFRFICNEVNALTEPMAENAARSEEASSIKMMVDRFAELMRPVILARPCVDYPSLRGTTLCYDKHNASLPEYTDTTSYNPAKRQFAWLMCNEPLGWWIYGLPASRSTREQGQKTRPAIGSRLLQTDHRCEFMFPQHNFSRQGKTVEALNSRTGGWNWNSTERIIFVDGELDPWRGASVSSDFRPGGPLQSSNNAPVFVVPNATHMPDWFVWDWEYPEVKAVVDAEVAQLVDWVEEFWQVNGRPEERGLESSWGVQ